MALELPRGFCPSHSSCSTLSALVGAGPTLENQAVGTEPLPLFGNLPSLHPLPFLLSTGTADSDDRRLLGSDPGPCQAPVSCWGKSEMLQANVTLFHMQQGPGSILAPGIRGARSRCLGPSIEQRRNQNITWGISKAGYQTQLCFQLSIWPHK